MSIEMTRAEDVSIEHLADHYRPAKPGRITRMLWWCAGADPQILAVCPSSDHVKYQGLGGTVFATGVLAFCSAAFAFDAVFRDPTEAMTRWTVAKAGFAGMIYALCIFNVDRFIVSTTGVGDGTERITLQELVNALPRILMALIIGFCMSKPLEIAVLHNELDAELAKMRQHYVDPDAAPARQQLVDTQQHERETRAQDIQAASRNVTRLEGSLREATELADRQATMASQEVGGHGRTGHAGRGDATIALENHERESRERQEAVQRELVAARERHEHLIQAEQDATGRNFEARIALNTRLEQIRAAEAVREIRPGLGWRIVTGHMVYPHFSWALTFLLVAIEICPILFKLMVAKSTYDFLKENLMLVSLARAGIQFSSHRHPAPGEVSVGDGVVQNDGVAHDTQFHEAEARIGQRISAIRAGTAIVGSALAAHQEKEKSKASSAPHLYVTHSVNGHRADERQG